MSKLASAILRLAVLACSIAPLALAGGPGPSLSLHADHKWLFGLGSTLRLSVSAVDENGHAVERPGVEWSTSNESVATTDQNGFVVAAGYGSALIRADWRGLSVSVTIHVSPDVQSHIEPSRSILFENVNVVPMTANAILERRHVLVRRGRIDAIGQAGEVEIPADAERIQADGLYLMPGLAEMHTHFVHGNPHWRNDLFLYAANGVTTVREMWGSTEFLPWSAEAASGAIFAPSIYVASPGMDGPETRFGVTPVTTPEQARTLVASYKRTGFDFIKVYTDLRPDVYQAILDEAARQAIRVVGHAPKRVAYETVITNGQASIEHLSELWRRLDSGSFYSGTLEEEDFARLTNLMLESKVWIVPTMYVSIRNVQTVAAIQERREIRYVSPQMRDWFNGLTNITTTSDVTALKSNLGSMLQRLHKAGVQLMLGSDCGYGWVIPGFAIHDELKMTVEAGLSPYEALRLATVNPAWFLGTLDQSGTVETGKRADLILVEENPLEEVANAAKRVGVLIGGRWRSEKSLRLGLEEIAREYAPTRQPNPNEQFRTRR